MRSKNFIEVQQPNNKENNNHESVAIDEIDTKDKATSPFLLTKQETEDRVTIDGLNEISQHEE